MGCTLAKSSCNHDENPRIFHVQNVDDHGQEFKRGKIEINDQDLILYQKGKEAIRWPLRSLRRYGFDAELFSFESGRRCPTGPGIYAFKCQRAEALFNLLQEFIVRAGQEDHRQTAAVPDGVAIPLQQTSGVAGRPGSLVEVYTQFNDSPRSNNARHDYMNGDIRTHEYVNTSVAGVSQSAMSNQVIESAQGVTYCVHRLNSHCAHTTRRSNEHVIQYAELDLPKTDEDGAGDGASGPLPSGFPSVRPGGIGADDEESSQSMYINVPATEIKRTSVIPQATRLSSIPKHVDDPVSCPKLYSANNCPSRGDSFSRKQDTVGMNYIQLDLHNSNENLSPSTGVTTPMTPNSLTSTPDSTVAKTDSYAMIDFDRTQALHARTAVSNEEEGVRKTRHNSNIDELN